MPISRHWPFFPSALDLLPSASPEDAIAFPATPAIDPHKNLRQCQIQSWVSATKAIQGLKPVQYGSLWRPQRCLSLPLPSWRVSAKSGDWPYHSGPKLPLAIGSARRGAFGWPSGATRKSIWSGVVEWRRTGEPEEEAFTLLFYNATPFN